MKRTVILMITITALLLSAAACSDKEEKKEVKNVKPESFTGLKIPPYPAGVEEIKLARVEEAAARKDTFMTFHIVDYEGKRMLWLSESVTHIDTITKVTDAAEIPVPGDNEKYKLNGCTTEGGPGIAAIVDNNGKAVKGWGVKKDEKKLVGIDGGNIMCGKSRLKGK